MEKIEQVYELSCKDNSLPAHIQKALNDLDGDVVVFINISGTKWCASRFYTEDELDINNNVINTIRYNSLDMVLPDLGDNVDMSDLNTSQGNIRWDTICEFVKNHLVLDLSWLDLKPKIKVCTCGGIKTNTTHSNWCDIH